MKHKLEQIRALKEMLAQLPPIEVQATKLTTAEAVKLLRPEVTALQRKGYTFDMIAKVLETNGLTISATTLRRYCYTKKPDAARKADKKSADKTAQPQHGNTQNLANPRTPSSTGATTLHPSGSSESGAPGAGGFTPREDTRDI